MPHAEIIQNGVVIIKPDPRMLRAIRTAQQFLGKLGKVIPGVRSLIRHELILRWLHKQLHHFAVGGKYRGKQVYIALDNKVLGGAKDLAALVADQAKYFLPIAKLEEGIRGAFERIAREKIQLEQQKKVKKRVQTYGEPWRQRVGKRQP